jgi:hypothetical protein
MGAAVYSGICARMYTGYARAHMPACARTYSITHMRCIRCMRTPPCTAVCVYLCTGHTYRSTRRRTVRMDTALYSGVCAPDTRTAAQGGVQCIWTQPCTAVYVSIQRYMCTYVHVSVQRYMYPYAPDTRTAVQGGVQCKWTQPCTAVYVSIQRYMCTYVHVSVQRYMYPYAPDTRTAVQGGVQCVWTQPCTAVYVRARTYAGYPARNAARMYTGHARTYTGVCTQRGAHVHRPRRTCPPRCVYAHTRAHVRRGTYTLVQRYKHAHIHRLPRAQRGALVHRCVRRRGRGGHVCAGYPARLRVYTVHACVRRAGVRVAYTVYVYTVYVYTVHLYTVYV